VARLGGAFIAHARVRTGARMTAETAWRECVLPAAAAVLFALFIRMPPCSRAAWLLTPSGT